MFGYVTADASCMSDEEITRYRSCYCGLCRQLRLRHKSHLILTYDMAFLVMLLSALYEPEETKGEERCIVHPFRRHSWWTTNFTDYAADMNLALAYHNCMDDYRDDKNIGRLLVAKSLESHYSLVREAWSEQCGAIETCMDRLSALERDGAGADEAANCFGELMGKLFAVQNDMWSGILFRSGAALGRFIYLTDAVLDLEGDLKHGRYNPIAAASEDTVLRTEPETVLRMMLAESVLEFEKLPIVQDVSILRNILNRGVWQRYAAETAPKNTQERRFADGNGSLQCAWCRTWCKR